MPGKTKEINEPVESAALSLIEANSRKYRFFRPNDRIKSAA
jgi:hypothetical protein